MEQVTLVNQDVNIVAYYFKSHARRLRCFPKRMEFDGKQIDFIETGVARPVEQLSGKVDIFDMSDGDLNYRLEFNPATLSWRLIAVTEPQYETTFKHFAAAI